VLLAGCGNVDCPVDSTAPAIVFQGGVVYDLNGSPVQGVEKPWSYESSAPDGQYIEFSAGKRLCIAHGLRGRPLAIEPWVSFDKEGTKTDNTALASGNMAEIYKVTDRAIWVHNNTCGNYFLRLVAHSPVQPSTAPLSGDPCSELRESSCSVC
jgi:hypothetical protein